MEQRTTEWLEEQTNAVNTDVLRVFVAFKDATATELARRKSVTFAIYPPVLNV
jgi:hypothetical protein